MPSIEQLSIVGEPQEASELIAKYKYKGGEEGNSYYAWYRYIDSSKDKNKNEEEDEEEILIANTEGKRVYFPQREDIGYQLRFKYTPTREDGQVGSTQIVSTPPIIAGIEIFIARAFSIYITYYFLS